MKRVVSISIGSSSRNHQAEIEFMGESIQLERIGTDGDMKKAIGLLESLDGKVDAFGLGGISFFLYAGGRRYVLRDALRLVKGVQQTPIADGSGIKNTLESRLVSVFTDNTGIKLAGKSAVMVSAVERYAMAQSLIDAGCRTTFGDFMFGLGVPIPLHSLKTLDKIGRILLPLVTHMPFQLLYPTGVDQDKQVKGKPSELLAQAEVLAGDFHYIRRYLPDNLEGKIIITNTVTEKDHDMLVHRGAAWLATPSPNFSGRSFATNVLEALILAVSGKKAEELSPADYDTYIERLKIEPRIENLQEAGVKEG
jgi:hypothetical protein